MHHTLDNLIWNALITGNKDLAYVAGDAAYIKRDVGLFAGMKNNSAAEFNELYRALPSKAQIILFTPGEISVPGNWCVKVNRPVLQMVYLKEHEPVADDEHIVPLENKNIPAMLELTKMTNPGPFFSRTIEFGNYEGIFKGDQLIAMIGQRLQPFNYTEVSAVCTHPDHTGKGYAAKLLLSQISGITGISRTPFLHVYPENTGACKLYWKLGFETRKEIWVYFLEKCG